jgi:hypothetical protein
MKGIFVILTCSLLFLNVNTQNFSQGCDNIKVFTNGLMSADCTKNDQSRHHSTLDLNEYVGDVNGELVWGNSWYSVTCRGITNNGPIITALCIQNDASWKFKSIDLNKYISNKDGYLVPSTSVTTK